MRRNHTDGPDLTAKAWARYVLFAVLIDFLVMGLLAVRAAQLMPGAGFDRLREAVPPLVDLFVLGLLIILSMKTLTIWRNSETHAKRREMRTLVLILLGNTWLLFILAMYIAPIFRLLGIAG